MYIYRNKLHTMSDLYRSHPVFVQLTTDRVKCLYRPIFKGFNSTKVFISRDLQRITINITSAPKYSRFDGRLTDYISLLLSSRVKIFVEHDNS